MTKEQEKISSRNKYQAAKYFGITSGSGLCLHYTDINLRHNNIERYIQWNPDDLVIMTKSEHMKLHWELGKESGMKGKHHTEETKSKISKAVSQTLIGKPSRVKGYKWTEEQKEAKKLVQPLINEKLYKKVLCVETGVIYKSLKDAAENINKLPSNLSRAIKSKKLYNGYHWQYVKESENK